MSLWNRFIFGGALCISSLFIFLNMDESLGFAISRSYGVPARSIFALFQDGTFFALTGADEITFDLVEGGAFCFKFTGRGEIGGKFIEVIPNRKIKMEWNVEGFMMAKEVGTLVTIAIEEGGQTTVTVEHDNIPTNESKDAKLKAWSEILADMEYKLNGPEYDSSP